MHEKRMLIVPAELAKRIDENRGDMGQAEFIDFLIDSQLNNKREIKEELYVTKEEFQNLEQGMKDLFRSFLDFFLSFGLELGKKPPKAEFEELSHKLQGLEEHLDPAKAEKIAEIKWK